MCSIAAAGLAVGIIGTGASIGMGVAGAQAQADAAEEQYNAQVARAEQEQQQLVLQQQYYDALGIHRASVYAQDVAYRAQMEQWQNEQFAALVGSVQADAQEQFAAVHQQMDTRYMQAMDTMANADREAESNAAFVAASAAETGTVGNSVRLAQQSHHMKSARVAEIEYANLKSATLQGERRMKGIQAQMQNMINQAYPTPLAPIQLPEPVPYVLSQVAMPNAPSMAPYYLQMGQAVAGGLTGLGGTILQAYDAGLFNTTPTIPTGGYTSPNLNTNPYSGNYGYPASSGGF